MLISCPSCRRQLQLPEETDHGQMKCPACGNQFLVEAALSNEQIQQQPPKPRWNPESRTGDQFEAPPPLTGEEDFEDISLHGDDEPEARRRANSAALWFFATAGVTLVFSTIDLIKSITIGEIANIPFGGPERDLVLALTTFVMFGCGAVLIVANVFLIVAGVKLKSFGGKAWVITGIVLAFVQALVFGGSVLGEAFMIAVNTREALAQWTPLSLVSDAIIGTLNCVAGIKAILALNHQADSDAFARHRQLRRRRPIEDFE
jgi:predicted RNA-binding Zn-ribbon protein involved in translation (DUF1610 family)